MGIWSKEEVKKDNPMPPEIVRTFNESHDPEIGISGTTRVNMSPEPPDNRSYRQKYAQLSEAHLAAVDLEDRLEGLVKESEKAVAVAKKEYEYHVGERSKAAKARRETGDKLAALLGYKKGY